MFEARAVVTKESIKRNEGVTEDMYQLLPCVEVCEADRQECPCAPASGCYWLKSRSPIPRALLIRSVTDIIGSSGMGGTVSFDHRLWKDIGRKSRLKSSRIRRYFTLKESGNGDFYLYIHAEEDLFLEKVAVAGIFANPILAAQYPNCGRTNLDAVCNPMDVPFFTNEEIRDTVFKRAWSFLPQLKLSAMYDILNDMKANRST